MGLNEKLQTLRTQSASRLDPADWAALEDVIERLQMMQLAEHSLVAGDVLPDFELPQDPGFGRAVELHMFLPSVRMGEGTLPWDRPLGAQVTQGDLAAKRETASGYEVELSYPGGPPSSRDRDSSIVCVTSSVLPSWSEYSLNVTAASSCWSRSRALRGGTKYIVPSKMCVL